MARLAAAVLAVLAVPVLAQDPDRDGDGLSDFHERHKHGTDPARPDSDGDGVPDGDWRERREYAYTVRCVVHVLRPVTVEHLCDDYQDARVLDETAEHVELEVVLYPFNTVAAGIGASAEWRRTAAGRNAWTAPGPTADWTPKLREAIVGGLNRDRIDAATLDDRTLVTKAAAWLLRHAKVQDGFTTFLTSFDAGGRPFVEPELQAAARAGQADKGLTLAQQWERELSARGMFEHGVRGSCTSTAIYLNGCLRALGVPTRVVLCIPLIDANDASEHELVRRGIRHPQVRDAVLAAAAGGQGKWSSHTFNEVLVGGRWVRLNGDRLGQNTYDRGLFGLMTHVGTWSDWADARLAKTVGRRQALGGRDDLFGGPNPYSTIALRDEFGVHSRLPRPGPATAEIARVWWTDDETLPQDVRDVVARREAFGLIAEVRGVGTSNDLEAFLAGADRRLYLEAPGRPKLSVALAQGCSWGRGDHCLVLVPFGPADRRDLARGVPYRLTARNGTDGHAWTLPSELDVQR
jgi:hypothetical protein